MNKALNVVLNSFEAMQSASSSPVDSSEIRQARDELARVETQLDSVEQNIRQGNERQRQFNDSIRNGSNAASDLKSKFMGIVGVIGGMMGLKKVFDLSDELTQTTARLNMMNDGLQTTEELQNMIFASAQRSRGAYQATADAVSKMGIMAGDVFNSNAELVAFVEQLNKQFTIAGTSQEGVSAAMLQLTQAMGSGVLRGEELNSVFEQAPTIIQAIADYLDVPIGQIRAMAQEGQLSADVVKNAMLSAADETNAKFESMPKTIGQVWQSIKNQALMEFQPILQKINEIVNTDKFNNLVDGAIGAITTLASLATAAFTALASVAGFVYDNWSWIEPIIWAVIAAFIAYNAVSLITNGILAAQALAQGVKAAADTMQAGTTFAATVAQHGLNAALLACPLTWIILLIIAVIAAIIGVCQWIAKTTGVANSFFGVIVGGINVAIHAVKNAGLFIANVALGIWEALGACVSNIGTAFHNVIANIKGWFFGLLSTALTVVEGICAALNKLPFVEFDYSGISAKADEYAAKSAEAYGSTEEYKSIGDAFSKGFNTFDAFESGWASDAFNAGAAWGDGITDKVSGLFSGGEGSDGTLDAFNNATTLDGIYQNTGDTAGSTAAMADSMDAMEDSVEYMKDIAERETINRFTTAEISVEMKNENHINSDMDIDGVVEALGNKVYETMLISAEGVHE
jgi:tape measure domain-containing protein